ncbi:MAG: hypothetical protein JRF51_03505 [Deltaproteobacteria bacterium]|nr:hypothetical protein [Deltaproteobacteria bacterium]MBW2109979.1 hypothetical protein [Deltaproteobacteria bacterium]MBW2352278.1 hypothetical protein [Deltaproteobacteria bacterium]HDZ89834.1 hypothetical protein [Deltaproteobacteria bacterium]
MALITTVSPEKAEGAIAQAYKPFLDTIGVVPKPLEMLSASPQITRLLAETIGYYMQHQTLGLPLLTFIRMLVAVEYDYEFCIGFNAGLLESRGISREVLDSVKRDPSQAPLEDKDKAMLLFVLKTVKTPEAVEESDMDGLRRLGWNDRDIVDAVVHGMNMIGPSKMFKAFRMGD